MSTAPPTERPSVVTSALNADRLGVPSILFFVMSAAAPLTVVAGVIPNGFAATGLIGVPFAFIALGVVLAVWSVGYVAMSRHMVNAGAFYAYIRHGIGRPLGVGGAWVALIAYNSLQVGLYGIIGAAAQPLLEKWFHISGTWWVVALVVWAVVAVLGLQQIDLNGRILAVLLTAETILIVVVAIADLTHSSGGVSTEALSPGNLFHGGGELNIFQPGGGALLGIAILGFVGFESAVVFSEESKNPKRTIPIATFLAVGIIAAVYALASWGMTVTAGPAHIVDAVRGDPNIVFTQARSNLGAFWQDVLEILFFTSVFAAMISFHNTTARYTFALGRERVMPAWLGSTSARSGAPLAGSIIQSFVGLALIIVFAVAGWDPVTRLFYWGGTIGGVGVLLLIGVTSIAVIGFFWRNPSGENEWTRLVAPALATVALGVVIYLVLNNFAGELGVGKHAVITWVVPLVYAATAVAGILWALILRGRRPDVYATIGLGPQSVTAGARPSMFADADPAVGYDDSRVER